MIPTLLVFGLLFGRWWKTALLVGTIGWVILLWASQGQEIAAHELFLGAPFAFVNTAVGVAAHQALRLLWHALRPAPTNSPPTGD